MQKARLDPAEITSHTSKTNTKPSAPKFKPARKPKAAKSAPYEQAVGAAELSTTLADHNTDDGLNYSGFELHEDHEATLQAEARTSAARDAVFNTAELLESILVYLEPKNVFVLQRVCFRFQETIAGSPRLQEAMFLRPPARTPGLRWASESSGKFDKEPRLFEVLDHATPVPLIEGNRIRLITPTRLNTILQVATGGYGHQLDSNVRIARYLHDVVAPLVPFELRKKESWHRMHMSDPPATRARIDLRWIIKTGVSGSVERDVEDPNGITFGSLLDAALRRKSEGTLARGYWTDQETKGKHDLITLSELLDGLERKYGKKARLVSVMPCNIQLYDMVVPSQREWEARKA